MTENYNRESTQISECCMDGVAFLQKLVDEVRANVTGAAGNTANGLL